MEGKARARSLRGGVLYVCGGIRVGLGTGSGHLPNVMATVGMMMMMMMVDRVLDDAG